MSWSVQYKHFRCPARCMLVDPRPPVTILDGLRATRGERMASERTGLRSTAVWKKKCCKSLYMKEMGIEPYQGRFSVTANPS